MVSGRGSTCARSKVVDGPARLAERGAASVDAGADKGKDGGPAVGVLGKLLVRAGGHWLSAQATEQLPSLQQLSVVLTMWQLQSGSLQGDSGRCGAQGVIVAPGDGRTKTRGAPLFQEAVAEPVGLAST